MTGIDDIILTERESAQRLNISASVLRKYRRLGIGPKSFRIQKMIRYTLSDLHQWVESRKQATKVEQEIL